MTLIPKSAALVLCLLLPFASVPANELYETRVPVTGQGDRERAAALRTAFGQVLVKVTGHRDAVEESAVEQALQEPMRYVQQYFYQSLPEAPEIAAALHEDGYTQMLQARFDADEVNRMLRDAGVPLWGRTRPVTLLWVAVEDQGERWLLGEETAGPDDMRRTMEHRADERGIPLLFPLMDLEDRRQLHFTDIWGNFQGVLQNASTRYQPGAVLVGRLWRETEDSEWIARWSLYHEDRADHWSATDGALGEIIDVGIDGTADRLAARHARVVTPEGFRLVDVVVTEIEGIAGYDRAMAYLEDLDPVSLVQVAELQGDRVRFRLEIDADTDSLVRLIELGSALVPVDAASRGRGERGEEDVRELTYRLLP